MLPTTTHGDESPAERPSHGHVAYSAELYPDADPRFLDAASGLPLSVPGRRALDSAVVTAWADPSRRYPLARRSRRLLDVSRASVAAVLGIRPDGVFFTSGVAEAIHLALSACADRQLRVGAVEEIGVLRSCDLLASRGTDVSTIPVDRDGRLSPDALGAADIGSTALVVQDVNIEVGVRQPLDRLRSAVGPDVPIIMDARATLGRDRVAQSWDVLFAEAKLWGGPPGCALVAVREPGGFRPQVPPADGHGGIEPPAPAVALCASAAFALESSSAVQPGTAALSARLRAMVPARIPDSQVVGDPGSDFITMFTFLYVAADELIDRLARAGWSCASGASCTSDTQRPHHVLEQMHASTHGSLRISLPPWSREADLAEFVEDLAGIVAELRREAGAEGL